MPLPIPNRADARITLILPEDDAIALDTDAAKEAFTAYLSAEVPDAESLVLRPEVTPWRFTVRPLNEEESAIVEGMSRVSWEEGLNSGALNYAILRFALVDAIGDGLPDLQRERLYGCDILTRSSVDWIPKTSAAWLAAVAARWSRLTPEKKSNSTSSRGKRAGMRSANT